MLSPSARRQGCTRSGFLLCHSDSGGLPAHSGEGVASPSLWEPASLSLQSSPVPHCIGSRGGGARQRGACCPTARVPVSFGLTKNGGSPGPPACENPGPRASACRGRAGPRESALRTDLGNRRARCVCEAAKDRRPWSNPEGLSGGQTSKATENEWC